MTCLDAVLQADALRESDGGFGVELRCDTIAADQSLARVQCGVVRPAAAMTTTMVRIPDLMLLSRADLLEDCVRLRSVSVPR